MKQGISINAWLTGVGIPGVVTVLSLLALGRGKLGLSDQFPFHPDIQLTVSRKILINYALY